MGKILLLNEIMSLRVIESSWNTDGHYVNISISIILLHQKICLKGYWAY